MSRAAHWAMCPRTVTGLVLVFSIAAETWAQVPVGDPLPSSTAASAAPASEASAPDEEGRSAASIVAVVGDQVILLDEVIAPIRAQLRQARAQLPPDKYREVEWELLKQVTQTRVQRAVLIKELEAILPNKDIMPRLRKLAAADFETYLIKLAQESGLKSKDDLIERIKDEGSDIDALRREFVDNLLSQQYLDKIIKPLLTEPTRDNLLAYYTAHKEEFAEPAGVVWRHVQVRFGENRDEARRKIQDAYDRLAAGESFDSVARSHSDGPTAAEGGRWTLTSKGSYADSAVDRVLFSIPVGQFSQIIEGKEAFHLVLVERRTDGSPKPFADVQSQIKEKLNRDERITLHKKKMAELMAKHHIETIFDVDPSQVGQSPKAPSQIR